MQRMTGEFARLELLLAVNSDRILTVLMVLAALLAVGLVGIEYVDNWLVQAPPPAPAGLV